jgi:imidazolonepropionase-like amidohydrolase
MRRLLALSLLTFATALFAAQPDDDLAGARAAFDGNLAAIRERNRDKYLSYYLHSERLVRTGATGLATGFEDFAKGAGSGWPDLIEANDIRLTELRPGLVYGTYRYRVRYGAEEHLGMSERLFIKTDEGWRIALTGAIDAPPGTPAPARALMGATLVDGRGGAPVPYANVIIRDGKIECAGTAAQCPLPQGIDVMNVTGKWIAPGLIDAHVHFSQTAWADGRPDSLDLRSKHPYETTVADLKAHPERYARSYICSGVTSVFDVGGYAWTLGLGERFANDSLAPHVVAAGPLLSTLDHWLNVPAERQFMLLHDEASAREGVRYLASQGSKAVKVWYIVSKDLPVEKSEPFVAAAGDEAHKHNLPLIVHATGLAEAKAALRAGANVLVHSVEDLPVDQEFIDLARKNGTVVIPTLTVIDGYVRMYRAVVDRKAPAIDDPNGCVDSGTLAKLAETATVDPAAVNPDRMAAREARAKRFADITRQNLKALVEARIAIATGTDAGNPLTLHGPAIYAELDAMQASGMSPMQVIIASTQTAARAMGIDSVTGTLEPGKSADFVVLDADPTRDVGNFRKLRFVSRAGVVRSIEDLHALAQNPQPAEQR